MNGVRGDGDIKSSILLPDGWCLMCGVHGGGVDSSSGGLVLVDNFSFL